MRQNKIKSLCYMRPTRSTSTFSRITIEKHCLAFVAESPIGLCIWCVWNTVGDGMVKFGISICYVTSASRTAPLLGIPIVKHCLALGTTAPSLLCGRGFRNFDTENKFVPLSDMGPTRCTATRAIARVEQDLALITKAPTSTYYDHLRACPIKFTHYPYNEGTATIFQKMAP